MREVEARFSGGRFLIECPFCSSQEQCEHYIGRTIAGLKAKTANCGEGSRDTKPTDSAVKYGWAHHVYREGGADAAHRANG